MIEAEHLSFRTHDSDTQVLRNISVRIRRGERIAMVGPSGSGKTTLALHLAGLQPVALPGKRDGSLRFFGEEMSGHTPTRFAGIVLQNPECQLFAETAEAEIDLSIAGREMPCPNPLPEREKFLALFGLGTIREAPLTSLSLGWKQRVSIAAMLAARPQILVLDEPTNYLDAETANQVFRELRRLSEEEGITILVIEHDLERVLSWATRVLALTDGEITFDGMPDTYRALQKRQWQGWIPMNNGKPPAGEVLLRLAGTGYRYSRGPQALADVNLTIRSGECVALLGPNGSGKSTLLGLVKGLLKPLSGSLVPKTETERLDCFGFVFQNPDDQIFAPSVHDECAFLLRNLGVPGERVEEQTTEALVSVGLNGCGDRFPFTLSYGEKRRLTLASVLVGHPRLFLLDEPTVGLDVACLRRLGETIRSLREQDTAVLFATHDETFAGKVATRIVRLRAGRIESDRPCYSGEEQT